MESKDTMIVHTQPSIIDEAAIAQMLEQSAQCDAVQVREVLEKARAMNGLDSGEVAVLMSIADPVLLGELFSAARHIKDEIYGSRLVLFAPLYVSNFCDNECLYCAFRAQNKELRRKALSQQEIETEVQQLIRQGHKRLLLVAGESYPKPDGFNYILKSIETIYNTSTEWGGIRRVNVNIAPLTIEQYRELKAAKIGTYQLFQETFHRATYSKVHTGGIKRNFDWRITAIDRAMQAGIDDVGVGRAIRPSRLEVRSPGSDAVYSSPGAGVWSGPPYHQRAKAGARAGFGAFPASHISRRRHGFSEDRGDYAPGGSLHRHHHVHTRKRRHCAGKRSHSGFLRYRPAVAPIPAGIPSRVKKISNPNSALGTIAISTKWCVTRRRWATFPPSAPDAIAWDGRARTLWIWPSLAKSNCIAPPMPYQHFRNTFWISPANPPGPSVKN